MLTSNEVKSWLKEVPFRPFRIVTSSGAVYDVHHPDMVLVTKRVIYVGIIDSLDPLLPDQVAHVSVLHISELKTIPLKVPA